MSDLSFADVNFRVLNLPSERPSFNPQPDPAWVADAADVVIRWLRKDRNLTLSNCFAGKDGHGHFSASWPRSMNSKYQKLFVFGKARVPGIPNPVLFTVN